MKPILCMCMQMASASDEERILCAPSPLTMCRGGRPPPPPFSTCRLRLARRPQCGAWGRHQRCERCRRPFCPRHARRVFWRAIADVEEHGDGLCMGWGMGSSACLGDGGAGGACSSGAGDQLRHATRQEAVLHSVLRPVPPDRPRSRGCAGSMRRAYMHSSGYMEIYIYIYIYVCMSSEESNVIEGCPSVY